MREQDRVADFFDEHDLEGEPAYQLLDLTSEVGELAKDAVESTDYGASGEVEVKSDEVGDVLFSLLAVANSLDLDASACLDEAIEKYESRIEATGTASSGE
ncbi:MazG nucleotide pyrophosphohydrolase domain-containing protein [Halocalculus aciditolerans]|uniref:NTP pyrophosphohydrolase MazG-like domain-containing protein n=1 Tax=Halocalculus aciditolerans TaxID=1383812 RepID=A0A830F6H6_9EURY|nr:MazG-like family protein [Halocalculus aciditolerans]GGL59295.1 hypothetical protein GCM10009039_16920 [Halocalculus aciditolerans]